MQIYEAQRVPIKLDLKRTTQRHIIFKMPRINDKERILQAAREKRIQKNKDSISSLWDNFKRSNIHNIGMPERKEKEIGSLFEKVLKENFPN